MIFFKRLIVLCSLVFYFTIQPGCVITNTPLFMGGGIIQIGDAIACYCLAKILSIKYNIPFVYSHFEYHDLFVFSDQEKSDLVKPIWTSGRKRVFVNDESDIVKNLNNNVIFYTGLKTRIDYIDFASYEKIKQEVQFKVTLPPQNQQLDYITVGVHIRKGNGGGQLYDGEVISIQEFDFDRSKVQYDIEFDNFPFDWQSYQRENGYFIKDHGFKAHFALDTVEYIATKFPPDQFYIDMIRKVSGDLQDKPLVVQLFTDDKNPEQLLENISRAVNKSNILFRYENNRHLSYQDRILHDITMLSRSRILIRPQSGFSRIAEIMGNHQMVIYPLDYEWEDKKLLMTHIVIRGSIDNVLKQLI